MEDVRTVKFALIHTTRWYPNSEAFAQGFGGEDRRYTFAEANREALSLLTRFRTRASESVTVSRS